MVGVIERDPKGAADVGHDLLVIGGGIYGVSAAMEAARRGLRPILVEKDDFGGATSWNALRILHGGLRYLQTLDLGRFRESLGERRWFLREFPELTRPLPCILPLHGAGLRRPLPFRAVLGVNDALGWGGNSGLDEHHRIARGKVLSAHETREVFPSVRREGLRGAARWEDAVITSPQRILMELLRWACANGARALNYVEARALIVESGRARGAVCVDRVTGSSFSYRAERVLNCAGPWCRELAASFDRDILALFRPSLAFNAMIGRPPLSRHALAVAPPGRGARTYFLIPWRDRILAGTYHAPVSRMAHPAEPAEEQVRRFVEELNEAIPGLALSPADLLRVHAGYLPARVEGSDLLARRALIHDHGASGGPRGVVTISGVKYTTARLVAEKALRRLFGRTGAGLRVRPGSGRPPSRPGIDLHDPDALLRGRAVDLAGPLRALLREEAVLRLDDLILRRTDWGHVPREAAAAAVRIREVLGLGSEDGWIV